MYAWAAEVAGVSFPLFEQPSVLIPHFRGTVFMALQSTLEELDGTLLFDQTFICPPLRENDQAIMEIAMKGNYTKKELMRANGCREYLGVQYLSKVAYPHGRALRLGLSSEFKPLYVSTRGQVTQARPGAQS